MVSIRHRLNRTVTAWRPTGVDDGAGGRVITMVEVGEVAVKIDQPSAAEQEVAAQWGATITHAGYAEAGADIYRGDELRGDDGFGVGEVFRVVYTVRPSQPRYLKFGLDRRQGEPAGELS